METKLYVLQEEGTTGWENITSPLTREDCSSQYKFQVSQGTNPERLRIVRVQ